MVLMLQHLLASEILKPTSFFYNQCACVLMIASGQLRFVDVPKHFPMLQGFAETIMFHGHRLALDMCRGGEISPRLPTTQYLLPEQARSFLDSMNIYLPSPRSVVAHRDAVLYDSDIKTTGLLAFLLACGDSRAPKVELTSNGKVRSRVFLGSMKEDGLAIVPSLGVRGDQLFGLRQPLSVSDIQSLHDGLEAAGSPAERMAVFMTARALIAKREYSTEANAILASSFDGRVQLPVGTYYTSAKGAWTSVAERLRCSLPRLLVCEKCLHSLADSGQVAVTPSVCDKYCAACCSQRAVCSRCENRHQSVWPQERQCSSCCQSGETCTSFLPVIIAADSLSKQQTFRGQLEDHMKKVWMSMAGEAAVPPSETFPPVLISGCSDAAHDAKLLRNQAFNWWLYVNGHLVCIPMLLPLSTEEVHTDFSLRRDVFEFKDMQSLDTLDALCDPQLRIPAGYMVRTLCPETDRRWLSNMQDSIGTLLSIHDTHHPGWYYVTDRDPRSGRVSIKAVKLHCPADIVRVYQSTSSASTDTSTDIHSQQSSSTTPLLCAISTCSKFIVAGFTDGQISWGCIAVQASQLHFQSLIPSDLVRQSISSIPEVSLERIRHLALIVPQGMASTAGEYPGHLYCLLSVVNAALPGEPSASAVDNPFICVRFPVAVQAKKRLAGRWTWALIFLPGSGLPYQVHTPLPRMADSEVFVLYKESRMGKIQVSSSDCWMTVNRSPFWRMSHRLGSRLPCSLERHWTGRCRNRFSTAQLVNP
eukprot:m.34621 g.34621  ORF g.34621 m.34621 type:complete len:758 (-) comp5243_c0_seq1:2208-4481(-)